jgi:translation initiation factor IF-3
VGYFEPVDLNMALWYTRTESLNPGIIRFFHQSYKERAITKKGNPTEYRINDQIRAQKVRLIDGDGKNIGVVSLREAQDMAYDADLDLVEVAPGADPPVCKVMDFGKFQYEQAKKEREARKQQKTVEIKEIRLRPKTTDHHRSFKVRDARRWLEDGMKVRVRIRFRGREITYPEIGLEALDEIAAELEDVAVIEQRPGMEGRTMLMVLAPKQAR